MHPASLARYLHPGKNWRKAESVRWLIVCAQFWWLRSFDGPAVGRGHSWHRSGTFLA